MKPASGARPDGRGELETRETEHKDMIRNA